MFYAVLQAFFNCREEGLRNSAAEYLFFKDKSVADCRLKFNPNIAELTMTAGLFLMFALYFYFFANGFTVSDSRSFQRNINAELIFQFGNQNIQMLFAQTGNSC